MYNCVRLLQPRHGLLLAVLLWCGAAGTAAAQQPSTLLIGTYLENNYSTQPGLQVSYSPGWMGARPRFAASYSTTRIATALGSNALAEDRFQVGAGWLLRPARTISPFVGVNLGYTRFDREDEQIFELLENSAPILSLLFGLEARLNPALRASGNIGYSALQSSTVYPYVATVGLHYHLNRGTRR